MQFKTKNFPRPFRQSIYLFKNVIFKGLWMIYRILFGFGLWISSIGLRLIYLASVLPLYRHYHCHQLISRTRIDVLRVIEFRFYKISDLHNVRFLTIIHIIRRLYIFRSSILLSLLRNYSFCFETATVRNNFNVIVSLSIFQPVSRTPLSFVRCNSYVAILKLT